MVWIYKFHNAWLYRKGWKACYACTWNGCIAWKKHLFLKGICYSYLILPKLSSMHFFSIPFLSSVSRWQEISCCKWVWSVFVCGSSVHGGFSGCILTSLDILCVGIPLLWRYSNTRSPPKIRPLSTRRKFVGLLGQAQLNIKLSQNLQFVWFNQAR